MIALRTDHQINHRLTFDDFFALGLCHTTGHTDLQIGVRGLQPLEPAQFGVDLFGRFFTNMAGVEQNHIRVIGGRRFDIAFAAQRFGHAFAVVDVHLTAIGLDIKLLWRGHEISSWVGATCAF